MKEGKRAIQDSGEIKHKRLNKRLKLKQLGDYTKGYTSDRFLADLVKYFSDEVDFNLDNVRKEIEQPEKLKRLINKAREKDTHPVAEFIEELFKDLAS